MRQTQIWLHKSKSPYGRGLWRDTYVSASPPTSLRLLFLSNQIQINEWVRLEFSPQCWERTEPKMGTELTFSSSTYGSRDSRPCPPQYFNIPMPYFLFENSTMPITDITKAFFISLKEESVMQISSVSGWNLPLERLFKGLLYLLIVCRKSYETA